MSLAQSYTAELFRELDYSATWLPDVPLALGDVVTLIGRKCRVVTNLRELGIAFKTRPGNAKSVYDYSSRSAVTMSLKLAGQPAPEGSILPVAQAGFHVRFGAEAATLFRATGCRSERIDALDTIGADILARNATGEWPDDQAVVTEVVTARSCTILIANGSNAGIDLTVTAAVAPADLHIASAEAELRAVRESSIGLKIITQGATTPLFRTTGIIKRLLRSAQFRTHGDASIQHEEVEKGLFEDVDYSNYEE